MKNAKCCKCGYNFKRVNGSWVDERYNNRIVSPTKVYSHIGYLCCDCTQMKSYTTENNNVGFNRTIETTATDEEALSKQTMTKAFRAGIEFETDGISQIDSDKIISNGWILTSDSTVWREYKSPVSNFTTISKQFHNLNLSEINVSNRCGTHFNLSNWKLLDRVTSEKNRMIIRFYHSLFVGLSDFLYENDNICKDIFGRPLGVWASRVLEYSEPTEHTNFINVSKTSRLENSGIIEFRICKFISPAQYSKAMKVCRQLYTYVAIFAERSLLLNNATERKAEAKKCDKAMIDFIVKAYNGGNVDVLKETY